jgi:hypothetical protein
MELAAHIVDIGVVIPLLATVLFVEQRLKRKGILRELEKLERLNDQTYELQFKENPHACEDLGAFNKIMDVCCGILLLVRVAAGAYSSSNDPVVLERIGVIRRGCNDNHRNLMMNKGDWRTEKHFGDCGRAGAFPEHYHNYMQSTLQKRIHYLKEESKR